MLHVGKYEFLLSEEEVAFWKMLERHGEAFAFYPNEIKCADPKKFESMVIFTIPRVVEPEADTRPKSTFQN